MTFTELNTWLEGLLDRRPVLFNLLAAAIAATVFGLVLLFEGVLK